MPGQTYNQLVQQWADHIPLQTLTVGGVLQFNDVSGRYQNEIVNAIAYGEGLMYRDPDLDFLATRETDSAQSTAAGSRYVTIPSTFIVLERLNLITPAGSNPDAVGASRVPLIRTTSDVIDTMWPETSNTAAPSFGLTHWAIFDMQETGPASQVRIAPTPDAAYVAEFKGTFRPAPLAQTASAQTFLTEYLPDLFFCATMIHWAFVMKSAEAQTSWKGRYADLNTGAAIESARQKSQSADWQPYSPAPVAAAPGR